MFTRIPLNRGLSYDDVLLKPRKTSVKSLSDVDTSTELAGIELTVPVTSAAMDTVTEKEFAEELARLGGLGVIHRFLLPDEQADQVREVKAGSVNKEDAATDDNGNLLVGAAIGLHDEKRAEKLVKTGVDALVLDIAHGHHQKLLEKLENYSERYTDTVLIAGNVATAEAARDLEKSGADVVKVGIGPGSACTTREMTGVGVPQFTAVRDCADAVEIPVIADGGIRKPGELAKAVMAGASAGMMGGMFAGTDETPGEKIEENGETYKKYRGMSSKEAAEERSEKEERELKLSEKVSEGESDRVKYKGELEDIIIELKGGLSSSISYCGADNLIEARENAEFVEITSSTQYRNGSHMHTI
jgi:IMP dehydrogenase